MTLGARLARCALGAVYGSAPEIRGASREGRAGTPLEWKAPDLVEAALEGGHVVRLRFAPVLSRLESHDPKAMPFRVEDDDGFVPVEKAIISIAIRSSCSWRRRRGDWCG